ncbi:MAG TPA: AAA domain-containing protein [Ktedonobacteraceae bacterium]|jgi:DNA replication ATP-dependent helicase Dna2
MAVPDPPEEQQTTAQTCFLCALDPHPCAVARLQGQIVAAHEATIDGESKPWVTLRVEDTYASITLTRYDRALVQGLRTLGGALEQRRLTLRVYHLPATRHTTTHQGRSVDRYHANPYTLAILEPDTILNITDLNQAEYCPRQYLLNRLAPSGGSTAALRGNLVHACFKELLKEQDRRRYTHASAHNEEPLAILKRHLERELARVRIDLALLNTSPEAMRSEVAPHLESLANWFGRQHATLWDLSAQDAEEGETMVRAETFLLAPEVGLRGRLDLLWQQNGRRRLLELKTGGASGSLPRSAHKWQVQGYHALLTVRRDSRMKKALATLLYSGTPHEAQDFGIPFTIRQLQQVNATRNTLVLSHVTGVPPAPPGFSRCSKCAVQEHCAQVSDLLGWQPPRLEPEQPLPAESTRAPATTADRQTAAGDLSPRDREFFARYYRLLRIEGHEIERQQALLWQTSLEERVASGSTISDLVPVQRAQATELGAWEQTFHCTNTSELRAGDEILLSDGNPITGEIVTGTILAISAEQVSVWTPELIARPALLDRYDTSIVHVRTVQNLLRWLQADTHLRDLVSGSSLPRFTHIQAEPRPDFNDEQNLAVARALQMRDYLLVHGPPGTGKTSVIAEIVKRLCQQSKRVLLAAFTNQAVDNMLLRLEREGFHDYLRLGHERSVDEGVRPHLLQVVSDPQTGTASPQTGLDIRELLRHSPVVASTTATWSSDKYTPSPRESGPVGAQEHGHLHFDFDVALIDEAGQLTIPAILGALRFARCFILVGDEKQLPPLVLSAEAGAQGLSASLFSKLKRLDEERAQTSPRQVSACVPLRVQYRMHETISTFASRTFYHGQLRAHYVVARRRLPLQRPQPGHLPERAPILQALRADLPLAFLDVRAPLDSREFKMSNAEARVVCEVIAGLLARGVQEEEIGVIAPYRAQVANLRRHLFSDGPGRAALPVETPLRIDTVDRFQGGERPVIIISFATPAAPPPGSQLRQHLTDEHRLNVALTRAQRKLILVGNAQALAELAIFPNLLSYCREKHALFTLTQT